MDHIGSSAETQRTQGRNVPGEICYQVPNSDVLAITHMTALKISIVVVLWCLTLWGRGKPQEGIGHRSRVEVGEIDSRVHGFGVARFDHIIERGWSLVNFEGHNILGILMRCDIVETVGSSRRKGNGG